MFLLTLKLNDKNSLYFSINKILFICTFCVFLLKLHLLIAITIGKNKNKRLAINQIFFIFTKLIQYIYYGL